MASRPTLLTGFIEGFIRWDDPTDPDTIRMIPFQSAIQSAALEYTGTFEEGKSFNSQGIRVTTSGCLTEVSAKFTFSTNTITFGLLQVAAATLAEDAEDDLYYAESFVVPSDGELELAFVPVANTEVCTTVDGDLIAGTLSGNTFTITNPTEYLGTRVTVSYARAVVTEPQEREIRLGSGPLLPVVGLYGRFRGCDGSYLVIANRVSIVPNLNLSVGDSPAEISFEGIVLADPSDTLVRLVKLNDSYELPTPTPTPPTP